MKKKIDPIGPQTKRETKKVARKTKVVTPYTPAKSIEVRAAKKKQRMKSAAAIGGSIIGTIGTIAADARLGRGSQRIYDRNQNDGGYKVRPTTREKWNAGKNKKSTKK